jgi:AraC-like DNA-binding protein
MRRLKQFEALVVHDFEESVFHMESHGHTYFEMGYIYSGRGTHFLNNSVLPYTAGDLFLLCPEDRHTFEIEERTRFVFIKFTDSYFRLFSQPGADDFAATEAIQIMRSKLLKENKLQINVPYTAILKNSIDSILLAAAADQGNSHSTLIYHQILSIIGLIKNCMTAMSIDFSLIDPGQDLLISYIHDQIYAPSALKIGSVALHFNISPKYFGAYFKRKFGIAYSQYVNQYKASLIQLRFQSQLFTLKQVAEEFGFADESHLSRFFKKYHHLPPGAYQKEQAVQS